MGFFNYLAKVLGMAKAEKPFSPPQTAEANTIMVKPPVPPKPQFNYDINNAQVMPRVVNPAPRAPERRQAYRPPRATTPDRRTGIVAPAPYETVRTVETTDNSIDLSGLILLDALARSSNDVYVQAYEAAPAPVYQEPACAPAPEPYACPAPAPAPEPYYSPAPSPSYDYSSSSSSYDSGSSYSSSDYSSSSSSSDW